jgi:hypothetical protein
MSGDELIRPQHGGRLEAKLVSHTSEQAAYELGLSVASDSWQGRASVADAGGAVSFEPWRSEKAPPDWLTDAARALLRSAWQRRRAGSAWPRRLARWRPGPDAGG